MFLLGLIETLAHALIAPKESSRCITHGSRSQLEHILCSHVRHFLLVVKTVRQTSHFHRTFCRGSLYTRCAGGQNLGCSFPISPTCLSELVACLALPSFPMIFPVEPSCFVDAARRLVWSAKVFLDWGVKEDVFVDSIDMTVSCRVWLSEIEVVRWNSALPYI